MYQNILSFIKARKMGLIYQHMLVVTLIILLIFASIGLYHVGQYLGGAVGDFLVKHRFIGAFHEPVIIHKAVASTTASVVISMPESIVPAIDINQVVYTVYGLESSYGKNDSCKRQGKVNGYGYGVYGGKVACYATHGEVTRIVEQWFEKRLKTMSLSQALCLYNRGQRMNDCAYYQNYLKLIK